MATFDPNAVRQAIAEFTPRRAEKFQDLIPAKAVIAELRQKRASYRAVADLLTQHCLPTSKTAIAMFCHQVLGETIRPRRRPNRKRPTSPGLPSADESTFPPPTDFRLTAEATAHPNGDELSPTRARGPRIAQIRKLTPHNNEKTDSHP